MGRSRGTAASSSSSSSSEFEFTVTLSPASKQRTAEQLCPADELFYRGQLLPLHLSPRISMVRALLLASGSASDSASTSASRDSTGSTSSSFSADCLLPDSCASSSRPSSAAADDALPVPPCGAAPAAAARRSGGKYFSSFATRFSSVFLHRGAAGAKKAPERPPPPAARSLAKEVIKKYAKKVRPFYEKLSHLQQKHQSGTQQQPQSLKKPFSFSIRKKRGGGAAAAAEDGGGERMVNYAHSKSFSGDLRLPRQRRCAASCPSSMRSSPSHSGLLSLGGAGGAGFPDAPPAPAPVSLSAAASMEELQSAIEGAIAHCKSTMTSAVSHRKAAYAVAACGGADEICAF